MLQNARFVPSAPSLVIQAESIVSRTQVIPSLYNNQRAHELQSQLMIHVTLTRMGLNVLDDARCTLHHYDGEALLEMRVDMAVEDPRPRVVSLSSQVSASHKRNRPFRIKHPP